LAALTDYEINLSVSESIAHELNALNTAYRSLPPIFAKLATKGMQSPRRWLPIVCGVNSKLFLSAKTEVELIVTTAPIGKYRPRNVKYLENCDRYTMMGSIEVE